MAKLVAEGALTGLLWTRLLALARDVAKLTAVMTNDGALRGGLWAVAEEMATLAAVVAERQQARWHGAVDCHVPKLAAIVAQQCGVDPFWAAPVRVRLFATAIALSVYLQPACTVLRHVVRFPAFVAPYLPRRRLTCLSFLTFLPVWAVSAQVPHLLALTALRLGQIAGRTSVTVALLGSGV